VVADWGLVRRPHGTTTARHTEVGALLGSEGFAPPEAYSDAHSAGFSWDVYSLGRVAAWAATGTWPGPLRPLPAPEPWRRFVRVLTDHEPARRPQDIGNVLEQHTLVTQEEPGVAGIPDAVLTAAKSGDPAAAVEVLTAALDYEDDGAFFIDELAELTGAGLDEFVRANPTQAGRLLAAMDNHLKTVDWHRRSFDHYNVPLHWMQRVAEAAANADEFDLMEDACTVLFGHEPGLDRYRQKERSRRWIASLEGEPARRVAQLLHENQTAARFYGVLKHAADAKIRAALARASDAR
jgi:hypothetical protein